MSKQNRSSWICPAGFVALGLIAAASYILLMEHREHVFQTLPYLILLLCPLMYIFMHRRHSYEKHDANVQHGKTHVDQDYKHGYQRGFEEGLKTAQNDQENKDRGSCDARCKWLRLLEVGLAEFSNHYHFCLFNTCPVSHIGHRLSSPGSF